VIEFATKKFQKRQDRAQGYLLSAGNTYIYLFYFEHIAVEEISSADAGKGDESLAVVVAGTGLASPS